MNIQKLKNSSHHSQIGVGDIAALIILPRDYWAGCPRLGRYNSVFRKVNSFQKNQDGESISCTRPKP
jgi:hypothetical protein